MKIYLVVNIKKILDKGREINANYPLNFTLNELIDLISNVEKLNADNVNFAKQKEIELQSLIQKKQAEIKAEEAKANAEKLKAAQLEEQKAEEERQKILDQQAEEENQRLLAEYAAADAAEKATYEAVIRDVIIGTVVRNFDQLSGLKFTITGSQAKGEKLVLVNGTFAGLDAQQPPIAVGWRVVMNGKASPRILDVEIENTR